jgi:putative restriction endonuclease
VLRGARLLARSGAARFVYERPYSLVRIIEDYLEILMDIDLSIRLAAFNWLAEMTRAHGEVLPRSLLVEGFQFKNERVPLIAPQGIFKPRIMELPLSITTSPEGPYDDNFSQDGYLIYKYRGTDPMHRDNVGLREVFTRGLPLIYLHGIVPGQYLAVWPAYLIGDDPGSLAFSVAVDELSSVELMQENSWSVAEGASPKRSYLTSLVKVRLHQQSFRERVLRAYRTQCSFCRLRHRELLDAAHIIPDPAEGGEPSVNNGIALCKLHHAAFDRFIIGVSPDYQIHVRRDVLEEEDGPMLQHGLKELHTMKLVLPVRRDEWPSQEALAWRFDQFKSGVMH